MSRTDRDFLQAQLAFQQNKHREAFRLFKDSWTKHQNRAAAGNLAELYYCGFPGVTQSYDDALHHYYLALQDGPGQGSDGVSVPKARLAQIMGNLTECINLKDVPPRPEHLDWLENTALKSDDKARKAMAALCLGLIEYDKGSSSETREKAAKYYRKAARLGSTGCREGDKAVTDAQYNLQELATTHEQRALQNLLFGRPPPSSDPTRTTQTMPPGTPTVALPTCGHCGRADATIRLKCSRCKQQYYCDKQCQVGAWSRHKKSCIAAS